jgi:hypothetical protein
MDIKGKLLSVSEKLTTTNKVDCVTNVPCTKIPEEICVPLIEVTDRMLAQSDTGECVNSAAYYTRSTCVCITFSQKLRTENRTF